MTGHTLRQSLLLFLTAVIWGVAFVAQSAGMEYLGCAGCRQESLVRRTEAARRERISGGERIRRNWQWAVCAAV